MNVSREHTRRRQVSGLATSSWLAIVLGVVCIFVGGIVLKDVSPTILQGVDFNLGMVVTNIGVFMVAIPVLMSFYMKPLQAAIEERTTTLESTFAEAEQLKTQMSSMRTEYEARLVAAEAAAREQIQAQLKEVQQLKATLMAEASAKSEAMLQNATAEIEREKQKVMSELRSHVIDLTLSAGAKLIGQNMDTKANRSLVEDFVAKAEAPH